MTIGLLSGVPYRLRIGSRWFEVEKSKSMIVDDLCNYDVFTAMAF